MTEIASETPSTETARPARHVVIGGGSGFVGTALREALQARGDRVTLISRQPGPGRITWDGLARDGLPACDVVVNLAGRHILDPRRRWDARYRDEVIRSRVETTEALVDAMNAMATPPEVFVSTAGKCFYGTREMTDGASYPVLDEESAPMGQDFPGELVATWEQAAERVDASRIRHVRLRLGIVLGKVEPQGRLAKLWRIGRHKGILPAIRPLFCLGLGPKLGHGRQPFPWVHVDDVVGIMLTVMEDRRAVGRYNCVAPGIVSSGHFLGAYARHLHRPVLWRAPRWLITRLVGAERVSILLEGQHVVPRRTLAMGYRFRFPTLGPALSDLVEITI
ncbi:MAG: TIGR01777 family oxidoreductase [Pseudomonadota bacterium]